MLSLIIFNVKVSTQRGVNSLHEAANKLFYIVFFFFRKGQHVKKKKSRTFYEAQFCLFYYDLLVVSRGIAF